MNVSEIAQVCHAANKALCETQGDFSQKDWDEAPAWQKESATTGVQFALDNPDAPDSAQHDAWTKFKLENGWQYGPVKDSNKKEHPCLVPFDKLPQEQQVKDKLFRAIVKALSR
jgi:ubiquitin-protein ligase